MMKGLSASLAMGLAVGQAPLSHSGTDDRYFEKEFESFMDRFDRKYSETEKPMRFLEFKRTFQLVASHNAKGKPYTMAVNKFADITLDEAKTMGLFGYNPKLANKKMAQQSVGVHSYNGAPLDASVDWRTKGAVTPVKNQGQCGSCWAFSTIAGLEGAWFQATGSLISMSEQQLTDCEPDFQPDGCNGGLTYMALKWQEGQTICTEASYPYVSGGTGSATQCHGSCSTAIPQGGITGYKLVTVSDENALASALMEHVVSVSIDASCDSFMNYGGGVYSDGCGTDVDHAVTAVGYAAGYWIVKNSWGTRWGDQGYISMQRGQGGEGIAAILNAPVFPIVKGAPGPAPTPSPPTPGPPSPTPGPPAPTPGPPAPTPGPPSPTPGPTPAPSSGNYHGPPCSADQVEASTGSGASYCAPSCDGGQCPSFTGSATPTCSDDALRISRVPTALRSPLDGRICSLVCNQSSDCPSGAICDDTICAWQSSSLRGSTNIVV